MDLRRDALLDALLSSNLPRLKAILSASPGLLNEPLNEMKQTLMHLVCFRTTNKEDILRYLLSLKPDVNLVEAAGFTPLLYAAKSCLWSTCILLLTSEPMGRSISVDVQTATGWNLLLMLCASEKPKAYHLEQYLSLFRLVHSRGVDYTAVSKHGETALHCAALSDNADAAEFLLVNSPIPVDAVNDMGESALFNAARAGYTDTAMLLLQYGANPTLATFGGSSSTPLKELRKRLENRSSSELEKLLCRMEEVVTARQEGRQVDWVIRSAGDEESYARPLSPKKTFLASTAGHRSEEQRSRSPGLTLGGQRQNSASSSLIVGSKEELRSSRADTVQAARDVSSQTSVLASSLPVASQTLPEPVPVAPLVECFDELAGLAQNVQKLLRKRGAKLYPVGNASSKKEKTCLATISMLVRRISCQRGSFRNFKNINEHSVAVSWNPITKVSTSNVRWAAIFHHRMLQCGRLMGPQQKQCIMEVLDFYLSMTKKKSLATSKLELSGGPAVPTHDLGPGELDPILVNDMRSYLHSHLLDPDNSLIGLRPSARLVGNLGVDLAAMHAACCSFDDRGDSITEHRAAGAPLRSRGLTITAKPQGQIHYASFPANAYPGVTKRDLAGVFVSQLQFVSDEELLVKSRALIDILKHDQLHSSLWEECKMLHRGDLVIAFLPRALSTSSPFDSFDSVDSSEALEDAANAGYSIMRYSGAYIDCWTLRGATVEPNTPGAYRGCHLRLYSIPEEFALCDVDVRVVVPFPQSSIQRIERGLVSSMEALIDGPIAASIRHALAEMSSLYSSLLSSKGADVNLLRRCTTFSVSLSDIDEIAVQHMLLTNLITNFGEEFKEFLGQMRGRIEQRHSRLVSSIRLMDKEFFPSRDARLKMLLDLPMESLLRNRLESYKLNIESAFDHLRHVRAGLADGTEKRNITSWWLGMISSRQKEFLTDIGYDFGAVPQDYIETKPANIDVVCDNLELIQACLLSKESVDKHKLKEKLLYPLMNEIYPRVNEFIGNIRFSLCDGLGISPNDFSLESANVLLKECADTEEHTFLFGLLKDLEYLETIKELEAEFMGEDWEKICGITSSGPAGKERDEVIAELSKKKATGVPPRRSDDSLKPMGVREQRKSIERSMAERNFEGKSSSGILMNDIRSSSESVSSTHSRHSVGPGTPKGALAARDQNIVPISGLIMNIFYRLENELRTVLEVWAMNRLEEFDRKHQSKSPLQLSPRSRSLLDDSDTDEDRANARNEEDSRIFLPEIPDNTLNRRRTRRLISSSHVNFD